MKKFLLKAAVDDTNIVSRAGIEALHWAQAEAGRVLKSGGLFTASGRKAIDCLCAGFRERNILPGGGADMLSATIFTENLVSGSI
ncbi:MAG: triphosphoribosyl-dephospho-CoA synthase [Bacillota bacterium]